MCAILRLTVNKQTNKQTNKEINSCVFWGTDHPSQSHCPIIIPVSSIPLSHPQPMIPSSLVILMQRPQIQMNKRSHARATAHSPSPPTGPAGTGPKTAPKRRPSCLQEARDEPALRSHVRCHHWFECHVSATSDCHAAARKAAREISCLGHGVAGGGANPPSGLQRCGSRSHPIATSL